MSVFLPIFHGQHLCRLHQSWQRTHINIGGTCISALNHINAYILSFESNFLDVIGCNFPCMERNSSLNKYMIVPILPK